MTTEEKFVDFVAGVIAEQKQKGNKDLKLLNMSAIYGDVGLTWLTEDGSFLIQQFKLMENGDVSYETRITKTRI